ncbi:MFS transporter [Micromonospora sp. KC606]|uniref:MFS transporter n=1 Tax=Micromonospora sp. KC606 TaxID=2530379 RepID=UPI001046C92B|nr:MFS transporter [Micromonospora sp. KC606]TDC84125.1 MFS transporter [Micromonospora sp. KC606]
MTVHRLGHHYRLLWSAAVASRFGDSMRTPALALLAATLTRDPRAVAVVTVAGQLPPLLFGLLGGVYADRWDRRRTMAVVDSARAAVVAALAVAVAVDRAGVAVLVAAAFLLAALGVFFDAAAFALLPALVAPAALPTANGRLQAGTAVAAGFLGAPLAGVLFAVSASLPFLVDALTFAAAALLVLALPAAPHPPGNDGGRKWCPGPVDGARPGDPRTPDGGGPPASRAPGTGRARGRLGGGLCREALAGVGWLRSDPLMWRIALLGGGANLAISGLMAVLVLYALDALRVPAAGYGLFMAGVVLGGLAGALAAGRLAARLGTVPALRAALVAQAITLAVFALVRQPAVGGLALAVFGAGGTLWNSLWAAYGQGRVPAGLLGRVGAAQRSVTMLTAPVGATAAGLAGAAYGVGTVMIAVAVVFALVTLAGWRVLRPAAPVPTGVPPTSAGTPARPGPPRSR